MTIIEKYASEREKNKDKSLLFLGTANSCFDVNYDDYDEIWAAGAAFGDSYGEISRIDLGFEIHPMDQMIKIADERHVDYNKYNCPILVQDENGVICKQLIKEPKTYPLDDILQYIKEIGASVYMTSTFCYMIVYAAMMGYKDILLYKILLTSDLEYHLERPGLEYWIDLLGHKEHIKFSFPEDAEMWSEEVLYGYKQRPNLWKLESRKKHLWECFNHHFYDCEALNGSLNRCTGMLEMFHIMNSLIAEKIKKEDVEKVVKECRERIEAESVKITRSREKYFQFSGAIQTQSFLEERGY
jgi:hypothetical protein